MFEYRSKKDIAKIAELEAQLAKAKANAHCQYCSTPMSATLFTGIYECPDCIKEFDGKDVSSIEAEMAELKADLEAARNAIICQRKLIEVKSEEKLK